MTTHDIYYTNKNLDGLSENEMKNACIRLRSGNNLNYKIQNNLIEDLNLKEVTNAELVNYENRLDKFGYKKYLILLKKIFIIIKMGCLVKCNFNKLKI